MSGALLVVIPCLNEEAHLPELLERLCADTAAAQARIVVADGGSNDASAEIVRWRAAVDARVVLLPNPRRLQAAGINLAVQRYGADAEMFVRVDAHAGYPADFLSRLLRAQRESGADSVTVSMRAVADTGSCFQRAAACAQNSVLGAGGSPHRKGGLRRWVEHGHHALFRTALFRAAGGYDESFTHNEDAELDARLAALGGRILLAGDILIDYFPRTTPRALMGQYFRYGQGRARTALKHRATLKLRQAVPALVTPALGAALLAPFSAPWLAFPALAWIGFCLGYGFVLGARERSMCACASGFAAALMHAAWSAGFCSRVFAIPKQRAPAL